MQPPERTSLWLFSLGIYRRKGKKLQLTRDTFLKKLQIHDFLRKLIKMFIVLLWTNRFIKSGHGPKSFFFSKLGLGYATVKQILGNLLLRKTILDITSLGENTSKHIFSLFIPTAEYYISYREFVLSGATKKEKK